MEKKKYITSPLWSIPNKENLSDPSNGGKTGVTDRGSFRNEKHTGCGNVMFQIACTSAIAWEFNYIATFPAIKIFYEILKHKNFKNNNIYRNINTFEINVEKTINLPQGYYIQKFLQESKLKDKNLQINSYYNCWKYFHKYRDKILDIFSIDSESMKYINNKYDFFKKNNINISLHIRRGDFAFIAKKWNKEYLLDNSYYYNSLNYLDKLINKKYNLLVFSDDIEYCKNNLNFENIKRNVY